VRRLESSLERAFGEQIGRWASSVGVDLQYIKMTPAGVRGWPDRVILWNGSGILFIEWKRSGEKLRPLQAHIHDNLRRMGFDVRTFDTLDAALVEVKELICNRLCPCGQRAIINCAP